MSSFKDFLAQVTPLLCPPGEGVYTVNTAKERRESLQKILYQNQDATKAWEKSLQALDQNKKALLLGVCSDTGGGILRGANWGPLFVRQELYLNHEIKDKCFDMGDVRVIPHLLHDKYLNEKTLKSCRKALYNDESSLHSVSPLSITEEFVTKFYQQFPQRGIFAIGGDHSISYCLVRPYLLAKKAQGKKVAVIHFDAHTDLLVERLGIDLCFGSWVTHVLDALETPDLMIQLGIRSSARGQDHWQKTFGVKQYWAQEIKKRGASDVAEEIVKKLKKERVEEVYVSFDIDSIDASYASATGTPEVNGLFPHEAKVILEVISKSVKITSADMMEVAPFALTGFGDNPEPDSTLAVAGAISTFLIEQINLNTK